MDIQTVKTKSKTETKSILKTIFQYSNILTLVGIIVAILTFYLAEKKKELTLTVDSFISLVDQSTLTGSGIKVSFDSVQVDNLFKVKCTLINTGNTAITSKDIVDAIKINIDSSAILLKYDIDKTPISIKTEDKSQNNAIVLRPDLLNTDDKIYLTIYYTANSKSILPTTSSRIIDGQIVLLDKTVETAKTNKFLIPISTTFEKILFWVLLFWNILFIVLMIWAIFIQKPKKENGFLANFIGFILAGSGFIFMILFLIANK